MISNSTKNIIQLDDEISNSNNRLTNEALNLKYQESSESISNLSD